MFKWVNNWLDKLLQEEKQQRIDEAFAEWYPPHGREFKRILKEYLVENEKRIEDSYVCDCNTNYGGRCLFPEKYRTIGCNGKGE